MSSLFVKVTPTANNNYDSFFYKVKDSGTWSEVLDVIESELDDQFVLNNESTEGLKLTVELFKEVPHDVEWVKG